MSVLVFYVPCPDEAVARHLADHLLAQKWVACAQIAPVQSAYCWQEQVVSEGEWVLLLKTTPEAEATVEAALLEAHPYQTPCILRYEMRANTAYSAWVRQSVITV